jgi:hypothetical protein
MQIRVLTTSLLVTGLLFSTLGCSNKDDPARTTTGGTGSYAYDSTLVSCQANASLISGTITSGSQTGKQHDYFQVVLQPTPPLPTSESVRIEYAKPIGQPNTAYRLSAIAYFTDNTLTTVKLHSNNSAGTLTETSSGVFAGTFSGTDFSNPGHVISAGTFTNVQL